MENETETIDDSFDSSNPEDGFENESYETGPGSHQEINTETTSNLTEDEKSEIYQQNLDNAKNDKPDETDERIHNNERDENLEPIPDTSSGIENTIVDAEIVTIEGYYDAKTDTIYMEGVELHGNSDKIDLLKTSFQSGAEGIVLSEIVPGGGDITYKKDYEINGNYLSIVSEQIKELNVESAVENNESTIDDEVLDVTVLDSVDEENSFEDQGEAARMGPKDNFISFLESEAQALDESANIIAPSETQTELNLASSLTSFDQSSKQEAQVTGAEKPAVTITRESRNTTPSSQHQERTATQAERASKIEALYLHKEIVSELTFEELSNHVIETYSPKAENRETVGITLKTTKTKSIKNVGSNRGFENIIINNPYSIPLHEPISPNILDNKPEVDATTEAVFDQVIQPETISTTLITGAGLVTPDRPFTPTDELFTTPTQLAETSSVDLLTPENPFIELPINTEAQITKTEIEEIESDITQVMEQQETFADFFTSKERRTEIKITTIEAKPLTIAEKNQAKEVNIKPAISIARIRTPERSKQRTAPNRENIITQVSQERSSKETLKEISRETRNIESSGQKPNGIRISRKIISENRKAEIQEQRTQSTRTRSKVTNTTRDLTSSAGRRSPIETGISLRNLNPQPTPPQESIKDESEIKFLDQLENLVTNKALELAV